MYATDQLAAAGELPRIAAPGARVWRKLSVAGPSVSNMSSSERSPATAVGAAIDDCTAVPLTGLPSLVQVAELETLLIAERRLAAEIARRLHAAQTSDALVAETGYGPRTWLISECQLSAAEASRRVGVARALPELPKVAAAFRSGALSHDHARVLARTLGQIEPGPLRDAAEEILVDLAGHAPPETVARAVADVRARLGLDETAEARWARRHGERYVSADRTFDGYLTGSYLLPPEAGSALLLALDAHTTPTGPEDDRTLGQRRADALTDIVAAHLGRGDLPDDQGDPPRVMITLAWADLLDQADTHLGALDGRWELTAAQVRRALCDAEILPAVLGGDSVVIDLGRTTKTWTTSQRRAVRLRDGTGCSFGACPHRWTRLHHAHWWSRGGPTDLTNAVPLCAFHHWLVHDGGWAAHRTPDGTYTFTNPAGATRQFRRAQPA